MFAALQEQLGLKLESTKRVRDIIVVDRVEEASGNCIWAASAIPHGSFAALALGSRVSP
jgi:hypothetical protein